MSFLCWCCVKYAPGGHTTFGAFINSFIHVLMYSYYALAALGPDYRKYTWWKIYLTKLQIVSIYELTNLNKTFKILWDWDIISRIYIGELF